MKAVRRYTVEIGNLGWAAPRDRMTEAHVLARTGLSLRTHQRLTVADYLRLRDLDPELPLIPVLLGQSITNYHRCADIYEERGINLAELQLQEGEARLSTPPDRSATPNWEAPSLRSPPSSAPSADGANSCRCCPATPPPT